MKRFLFIFLFIPCLVFGQIQPVIGPTIRPVVKSSIGPGVNLVSPAASAYDAIYAAFTTKPAADTSGFWEQMYDSIGTYWDSLDIFYWFAQEDTNDTKINWVNPGTHTATLIGPPTFTAFQGYAGGTGKVINTNYNPTSHGNNYTLNDASMGCYIRTDISEAAVDMGADDDANKTDAYFMTRWTNDRAYIQFNGTSQEYASNDDSRGMYIANRTAANIQDLYKNGEKIIDGTGASVALPDLNIYVLGVSGVGGYVQSDKQVSCAFAGAGLSQTAITKITDAIEACMDSMGVGIISPLASAYDPTNFYVADSTVVASASDLNSGTHPDSAWASITKVNAETFSAGDTIFFIRGGTWRGSTLTISQSGTSGNHIVFTNYGSGNLPKIYGSEEITTFTNVAGSEYHGNQLITINPNDYDGSAYRASIFFQFDDTIYWAEAYEADRANLDANYEYNWSNDTIYFFYDGSIEDINSIECTQIARGIQLSEGAGQEYITIDGFDLKYYGDRNIGTAVDPPIHLEAVEIRNCTIAYSGVRGSGVGFGLNLFNSGMVIEDNVFHDAGRRNLSINVRNAGAGAVVRDVIIQDNEFYSGWHTTGIDIGADGDFHTFRNIIIRRNLIWEGMTEKPATIDGEGISVIMTFIENDGGDPEDFDSIYFYSNVVRNAPKTGLQLGDVQNAFVVNNTFSGRTYTGGDAHAFVYYGGTGSSQILNNIFFNYNDRTDNLMSNIRGATGGAGTTFDTVDYNLHYVWDEGNYLISQAPGPADYGYDEWAALQAAGFEPNSLTPPQDPLFADTINDLTLTVGSPAIGAGTPVDYVLYDINGNYMDSPPTLGAYQTGASAPYFLSGEVGAYNDSIVVVTLTEAPLTDSVPLVSDFDFTEDGTSFGITEVSFSGSTMYLALDSIVADGSTMLLDYTSGVPALQSTSNVESQSWADKMVTNNVDLTAPVFSSAEIGNVHDSALVVTMTEALVSDSISASNFTITEDGTTYGVNSISVSTTTITFTLDSAGAAGSTYLIDYTPDFPKLQDAAGNLVLAWVDSSVTNNISAYHANYTPIYNKFTTPPTGDTLTWQNALVTTLSDSSVWAKLDWIGIAAVDNITDAMVNWVDTSETAVQVGTLIFTRMQSVVGDSSTSNYLDSQWNPTDDGTNMAQNSASVFAYVMDNAAADYFDLGAQEVGADVYLNSRKVGDRVRSKINDNTDVGNLTVTDSRGMWVISRSAADAYIVYRNISETWPETEASTGLLATDIHILHGNTSVYRSSKRRLLIWGWGANLTATDVRVLTNAIETYADNLGIGIIP